MAYFLDSELARLAEGERKGSTGGARSSFAPRGTTSAPQGGRRNKFGAKCGACGVYVQAGEGSLEKKGSVWVTTHLGQCP